ncbi:MAG: ATP phosphoribosyltransferase [Gilvibacter sp.]
MSTLKIAIQKKGRLSQKSLELLKSCGIEIPNGTASLTAKAKNFPLEILYLRDDDIPQYVEQQVADLGILGQNEVLEKQRDVTQIEALGFSNCRLSLAIPKSQSYSGITDLSNKRIATSYPNILKKYLAKQNVTASIEQIGGSVEIAPSIGLADGVCDIVSSGSTLLTNGLKEVEVILKSEAVLIANKQLSQDKQQLLDRLLFRLRAVKSAEQNKYILLNAPNTSIEKISAILPGMKSPTVMPLAQEGWSSMHSVVNENAFWEVIDQLKNAGAQGILVVPIQKMIA